MITSSSRTSAKRCASQPITRVVPAPSVWEPSRSPGTLPAGARVRTLAPQCARQPVGDEPQPPLDLTPDAQDVRRENRRTFLLGAVLGFTLVAGSLHLLVQEDPAAHPGYVSTVTAEVAK